MKKIHFLLVLWAAKLGNVLVRILHKGGSHISGAFALRLRPDFIRFFRGIDYERVYLITGTNGKSTSNNIVVTCLRNAGLTVTTNLEGANMLSGIATALIKDSDLLGRMHSDVFVFETDERSIRKIHEFLPAKNICVTNIQKDQVQRNGEPDFIYKMIRDVVGTGMRAFLNNEEPRSKSLERFASETVYYSVERHERSFEKHDFYDVTMPCPCCQKSIRFHYYNVDNIGPFACAGCGYGSERIPDFRVSEADFQNHTFQVNGKAYPMPYEHPFFLYNYALAIAVCHQLKIPYEQICHALKGFKNIQGRVETISYGTKQIKYMRIKQENPETMQSVINYAAGDPERKVLLIGLEQLEDFKPFYTNTFYAFDCDVKELIDSGLDAIVSFSGAVAYDAANRFLYAGYPAEKVQIVASDDDEAILDALDRIDCDNIYMITLLGKYESLVKSCARRGGAA